MTGASHGIAGLSLAMAVHHLAPYSHSPAVVLAALGAAAIGAFLPDIDADNSKIRWMTGTATRRNPILGGLVSLVTKALFGGHREGTHTPEAWLVASLPAALLYGAAFIAPLLPAEWQTVLAICKPLAGVALAFSVGYLSHLLADATTKSGIPSGFILKVLTGWEKLYGLPPALRYRTGTLPEYLIVGVLMATVVATGVWHIL